MPTGRVLLALRALDPGWSRAVFAVRGVLCLVAGSAAGIGLLAAAGEPARAGIAAGLLAVFGLLAIGSEPQRARLALVARLAPVGALSAAVAALLSAWPWASYAGVVVALAVAAALPARGARGVAMGLALFLAHFLALFLQVPPDQAGWLAAAVVAGYAALALVLVLWPDPPQARIRRLLPGFRARVLRVVDVARDATERGSGRVARRRLVAATAAVQETALLIEAALADPTARAGVADPVRLRSHVFVAELLGDHLAAAVVAGAEDAAARARLRRELSEPAGRAVPDVLPAFPTTSESRADGLVARIDAALAAIAESSVAPDAGAEPAPWPADDLAPAAPAPPDVARRRVVQVTLAGALSVAVGVWISETYWSYAVLGAFVTLVTPPSRAASLRRALDRTLGTALGVAAGAGLALLFSGASRVEAALVLPVLLVAFWAFQASYLVAIVAFTVVAALAYDLAGLDLSALLAVRLWETAAGAGLGAAVATLVMPHPTRRAADADLAALLDALGGVLAAIDPRRPDGGTPGDGYAPLRAFDRAVVAFRTAGAPLATGLTSRITGRAGRVARRDLFLAASLRFRLRVLLTATEPTPGRVGRLPETLGPAIDAVRETAETVRDWLRTPGPALPETAPSDALAAAPGPAGDALRALRGRVLSFAEVRLLD